MENNRALAHARRVIENFGLPIEAGSSQLEALSTDPTWECRTCGELEDGEWPGGAYPGRACPNCAKSAWAKPKLWTESALNKWVLDKLGYVAVTPEPPTSPPETDNRFLSELWDFFRIRAEELTETERTRIESGPDWQCAGCGYLEEGEWPGGPFPGIRCPNGECDSPGWGKVDSEGLLLDWILRVLELSLDRLGIEPN